MKKSIAVDKQCITKMLKYIEEIKMIIDDGNIASFQDLKASLIHKYAVTQIITNIYELSKKMQDSTLQELKYLDMRMLRTARQIASHNYDALDFRSIFNLCSDLADDLLISELISCLEEEE